MAKVTYDATGRRKSSVARVRLVPGEGNITINDRELNKYFGLKTLELIVRQPLEATETLDKYDVLANVDGGGISGQAGAISHERYVEINKGQDSNAKCCPLFVLTVFVARLKLIAFAHKYYWFLSGSCCFRTMSIAIFRH